MGLHLPPGRSQERAVKHLLEIWDSARLQDAGASSLYLLFLCPFRGGTRSEEQSRGSVTKQNIQRSPSASDTMAALAECMHSLNPTCSWERKMRPNYLETLQPRCTVPLSRNWCRSVHYTETFCPCRISFIGRTWYLFIIIIINHSLLLCNTTLSCRELLYCPWVVTFL